MRTTRRAGLLPLLGLAVCGCQPPAAPPPADPPPEAASGPPAVAPRVTIDTKIPPLVSIVTLHNLSISADGRRVAVCDDFNVVNRVNAQVWDVAGPKKVDEFENGRNFVALSPDGATVIYYPRRGVTARPVGGGKEQQLGLHGGRLTLSPAGDRLAMTADQGGYVWNLKAEDGLFLGGERPGTFEQALSNFFDDGRKIATGDNKGVVTVWDVNTGKATHSFDTKFGAAFTNLELFASPDGKYLAAQRRELKVFELPSGRVVQEFEPSDLTVYGTRLVFLPDGRTLLLARRNHSITLLDIATRQPRASLNGHTKEICAMTATPDGKTLVSADHAGLVMVWDVP